eukprot:gene18032-biopygen26983
MLMHPISCAYPGGRVISVNNLSMHWNPMDFWVINMLDTPKMSESSTPSPRDLPFRWALSPPTPLAQLEAAAKTDTKVVCPITDGVSPNRVLGPSELSNMISCSAFTTIMSTMLHDMTGKFVVIYFDDIIIFVFSMMRSNTWSMCSQASCLNETEITGIDYCYFNHDVPKTAFITPMELFEFKVLPFGLANSPSAFTEVMNTVFRNFIGKFVVIYLDDVIIFSKDDEEHEKHIRMVLQRLEDNHLFLSREKCRFFQPEVKYLGHVLSGDGIRVNATKVKAVNDWPTPKTSKEVQQFLGLSNFFRKFLQGYSSVAAPLIAIANQHDTRPGKCTGGVLLQDWRPIAFHSHKFSKAERNYSTGEQELLAVYLALKEWRCYLEGCTGQFELDTDYEPSVYLANQPMLSRKQARYMEFFSRFSNMKWNHIAGRSNVADPLIRNPDFSDTAAMLLQRLDPEDPLHSCT